jgi:hypothetical protein
MNPPAIDALFNRIARREVLPPGPVVDFDTAIPPLGFKLRGDFSEHQFPLSSSRRKLKLSSTPWDGVEVDTMYGSLRTAVRVPV